MDVNPKWLAVSEEILNADYYQKLRWRKTPMPVLAGEVSILLKKNNLRSSNETINAVTHLIKIVTQKSDLFYINNEQKIFAAHLGKLIKTRVKNLENPEDKANQTLKIWLKSNMQDFVEIHLTKTLNYNSSIQTPTRIPLNDLLELSTNWEYNTETKITAIAAEYYQTTKGTK
jgi:hypothetical protein